MLKSRYSIYQLNYPSNNIVTPIRDLEDEDNTGKNEQQRGFNPYSNSLWNTSEENRQALNRIREKAVNKRFREEGCSNELENQSLELSSERQPKNKKNYSPLDIETFSQRMKLESERPDTKTLSFVQSIQKLQESETRYSTLLNVCLSTYKEEACINKKFKNKLLNKACNEDLLLFGNLDTIYELSKLLNRQLKESLVKATEISWSENFWTEIKSDVQLCEAILKINFGSILKSHTHRIKITYRNYCAAHKERNQFLETLKLQNTELFYKWYQLCLKKAQFEKLEDLLGLPLQRLIDFDSLLDDISLYGSNLLSEFLYEELKPLTTDFTEYLRNINDELTNVAKNNGTKTPKGISTFHETVEGLNSRNPSGIHKTEKSAPSSYVSQSSSFYSDLPPLADMPSPLSIVTKKATNESRPLRDSINEFNKLHHNLSKWDKTLAKLELAKILDKTLHTALIWKNLIEFEPLNEIFTPSDNMRTIYGTYVEKVDKQRQQVMILQLQDLRKKVVKPLQHLLQRFSQVKQKINDRKMLKKEYLSYLKQQDNHDAKREILAKSFQELQSQLADSLPVFISQARELVNLLVSQYISLMMDYMKLLAGGEQFLNKELELLTSGQRELGDNFDILQLFCSSRYYTRQAVRENWVMQGDPRSSKTVRKLFEL